jgi:hypothetical protein
VCEPRDTYVLEDAELPLMVFGALGLVRPGRVIEVDGLRIPLPRVADLIVEKLLTDRTGEKGVRDLLVVAGLLATSGSGDLDELVARVQTLSDESRHSILSNLTLLSLTEARPAMPDPSPFRAEIERLLSRIEGGRE